MYVTRTSLAYVTAAAAIGALNVGVSCVLASLGPLLRSAHAQLDSTLDSVALVRVHIAARKHREKAWACGPYGAFDSFCESVCASDSVRARICLFFLSVAVVLSSVASNGSEEFVFNATLGMPGEGPEPTGL